jgi:gamma-glutamyltranspeptidase/glutathione hydrolase
MREKGLRRSLVAVAVSTLAVVLAAASPADVSAQRKAAASVGSGAMTPPADEGKRAEGKSGMVSSANGLASEAGVEILKAGGNAVDAAVATAFAVSVVEPQMSGLGGSGAAMVWMKREGKPMYLDFYAAQPADSWRGHTEPAPARGQRQGQAQGQGASPTSASAPASEPSAAEAQGAQGEGTERAPGDLRVVGIPGEVAGLLALHEKFGVLPRERVMAPAIRLAEEGFPVGQILADFVKEGAAKMKPFPEAMALFFPDGKPLAPGATLRNPALAESLRRIAKEGRAGFYEGPTAAAVVAMLNAGKHPATLADLTAFQPQWKRPLCTDYHGRAVLSAAPPETGMQVLHTLELLEPFDLKALGLPTKSAPAFDVLVSALRTGQSVSRANGDPNWVAVPANGISSSAFAAARKSLVGAHSAPKTIEPGDPKPFDQSPPAGACATYEPYGSAPAVSTTADGASPNPHDADDAADDNGEGETTHLSVVDKDGNAVALTQTNSSVWGSGGFTSGFFLNNSGFQFNDENIDAPSRSRWRIRTTTIAPTIVLQNGAVQMVVGAPGGGRIPTEIVQVMVYTLDYQMDPLDAVRMPRIFPSAQNPRVQLEHGFAPGLLRDVRAMGYDPVPPSPGYARLYMIVRRGDRWIGVADTRHDGEPRGY